MCNQCFTPFVQSQMKMQVNAWSEFNNVCLIEIREQIDHEVTVTLKQGPKKLRDRKTFLRSVLTFSKVNKRFKQNRRACINERFILKMGRVHFNKLFTNKKNILSFIYIYHYLHFFQKWTCPLSK